MDKEAIRTSYDYRQLEEQHSSGGYYSAAVREAFEAVKDLGVSERLAFYVVQFNETYEEAASLRARPEFDAEDTIDLSEEGLGVIQVEHSVTTSEGMEQEGYEPGTPGYRGLCVWVTSFNPNGTGRDRQDPYFWGYTEGWMYLYDDGLYGTSSEDANFEHLDEAILDVLEAKETLGVIRQALEDRDNKPPESPEPH